MKLAAIAAVSSNGAIGKQNQLPWHLPNDLRYFKKMTTGKPVLMGRNTFESFGGKPLPNRTNIVLSSQPRLQLPEGVKHVKNKEEALDVLATAGSEEPFIIGGAQIYKLFWEETTILYITHVATEIEDADAFFPAIDMQKWDMVWEEVHTADEKHLFDYRFCKYQRIS